MEIFDAFRNTKLRSIFLNHKAVFDINQMLNLHSQSLLLIDKVLVTFISLFFLLVILIIVDRVLDLIVPMLLLGVKFKHELVAFSEVELDILLYRRWWLSLLHCHDEKKFKFKL